MTKVTTLLRTLSFAGALLPIAAMAATPVANACALPYSIFEEMVPHLDLAECPQGMGGAAMFCRVGVSAEQAHVFVFDEATSCLVASTTWEEDAFAVTLD